MKSFTIREFITARCKWMSRRQLQFLFCALLIHYNASARSEFANLSPSANGIRSSGLAFPGAGLEISCSVSQKNSPMRDYQILIIENDSVYDTIFADLSMPIYIQLDLNKSYLLEFSKPGFMERLVLIDTKVPDGKNRKKYSYDFEIEMPFRYCDTGFYAMQPIARIIYDETVGDFGYDLEYARSIGNVPTMSSAPDQKTKKSPANSKRGKKKVERKKL